MTLVRGVALVALGLGACSRSEPLPGQAAPPGAALAPVALPSQPAAAPPAAREGGEDARAGFVRASYTKFEYRVPMRDGVRLFTSVYVPNDAGPAKRYPFLMVRTPYSVAPYGLDRYRSWLGSSEGFEKEGFIFVLQDVRGRHMSEGEFANMRPHVVAKRAATDVDESTDTYDTIAWLLTHVQHNNGRVGQWGISYPGFYTSAGAIDSHPALKAVSPQAPIADWWRGDDMHRHGALNLQLTFTFFWGFGKPRPEPTDNEGRWKPFEYGTPDAYDFYLNLGPLSEVDAKHFKGEVAFWKDLAGHPDYDDFWKARNLLPHLKNIRAAVLTVGGWYDTEDLYGPLATYRAIEQQNPRTVNTLIMGPWQHGGWARTRGDRLGDAEFGFATSDTFQPLLLQFFRHHLKGGDDPRLPEAMVFETGANRWRRFEVWPPREVQEKELFLREDGGLSFEASAAPDGFDEYLSDPARPVPYTQNMTQRWSTDYMAEDQRFAARRPDVLVYATAPLERPVTLAGPLKAVLHVSTTGTDADFVVKLIDVNPGKPPGRKEDDDEPNRGGQQTLVRGEPFRGRYRNGDDRPEAFVPGQVTKVEFDINDVFHTFQRGHRIMIQVQSSWFPFIDRNPQTFVPNIFEAKRSDFVKATHRVYRSSAAPSSLRVRVLPAADE